VVDVKRSLAWSFVTQYSQMIVGFLSSVALARLLSPAEIGVYALGMFIIGFAHLLRDFGVSEYIVQQPDLSEGQIQTAFTLNLATGFTMGLLILLVSKEAAKFYDAYALSSVLQVLAINFFIVPIGSVSFALLRREMRFEITSRIDIAAIIVTALVSIWLAFVGLGALSMAVGAVAGAVVKAAGCVLARNRQLNTLLTLSDFGSVWAYSKPSILLMVARHFTQALPALVIGRTIGVHEVGLFNKGRSTSSMVYAAIIIAVKNIMMPLYSKSQGSVEDQKHHFLLSTSLSLAVVWPALAFVFICSNQIVLLLFGAQWMDAVPVLQASTVGVALWCTVTYSEELFKATGRILMLARLEYFLVPVVVAIVTIGSQSSITILAYLLIAVPLLRCFFAFYCVKRFYDVNLRSVARLVLANFILTAWITAVMVFAEFFLSELPPLEVLVLVALIAFFAWFALLFLTRHPLWRLLMEGASR